MLDIRLFRNELEQVRAGLSRRGESSESVDAVVRLDDEVRRINTERDELRSRIRALSNEVGQFMRDGLKDEAGDLQAESRELGAQEKQLDAASDAAAHELRELLLRLPNLPSDDAPDGSTEHDNVVARVENYDPS